MMNTKYHSLVGNFTAILLCIFFLKLQVIQSFSPSTISRGEYQSVVFPRINGRNSQIISKNEISYIRRNDFTKSRVEISSPLFSSLTNVQDENQDNKDSKSYYIRRARYTDLREVTDILISSFYNPTTLVRPYLYLSELSRLQSNFPYGDKEHSFFVACSYSNNISDEKVLGFVDVDARPATKKNSPPRPYLSDLAVHTGFRRKGIAKSLIQHCEEQSQAWGKEEMYLRVERKNNGALTMYSDLGYDSIPHDYFGVYDTTILLKRLFVDIGDDSFEKQEVVMVETNLMANQTDVLDYVV